jgi:hypothetical protein
MNILPEQPLVLRRAGLDASAAAFACEPAFFAMAGAALHLALDGEAGEVLLRHLGYRVRRARGDLLSHARRVLLAHRRGDLDTSCAALVDLACALEDKGQALRRILFDAIASMLDEARHAQLTALLMRAPQDAECESIPGTLLRPTHSAAPLLRRRAADTHEH